MDLQKNIYGASHEKGWNGNLISFMLVLPLYYVTRKYIYAPKKSMLIFCEQDKLKNQSEFPPLPHRLEFKC